jgi:hypothetical protein
MGADDLFLGPDVEGEVPGVVDFWDGEVSR